MFKILLKNIKLENTEMLVKAITVAAATMLHCYYLRLSSTDGEVTGSCNLAGYNLIVKHIALKLTI